MAPSFIVTKSADAVMTHKRSHLLRPTPTPEKCVGGGSQGTTQADSMTNVSLPAISAFPRASLCLVYPFVVWIL
jgi:hypothetical protein